MQPVKHIVIAAAGMGIRMGKQMPKCMVEFNGKPLIEHLLGMLGGDYTDIRIVVGYKADSVISFTRKIRKDIIYVLNNNYMGTKTLASYMLGARYLKDPVYYMDADIYFQPDSLNEFFSKAEQFPKMPLIGVTAVKTQGCIFAGLNQEKDKIISFSRSSRHATEELYEWANIAYLPKGALVNDKNQAVYQALEYLLPLPAFIIDSYEMDTPEDVANQTKLLAHNTLRSSAP